MPEKVNSFLMHLVTMKKRQAVRLDRTFEFFNEKTTRQIKARADNGSDELVTYIPSYTTGLPIYNNIDVAEAVFNKFTKDGFYTRRVSPEAFYINWSPEGLESVNKKSDKKKKKSNKKILREQEKATKMLKKKWNV